MAAFGMYYGIDSGSDIGTKEKPKSENIPICKKCGKVMSKMASTDDKSHFYCSGCNVSGTKTNNIDNVDIDKQAAQVLHSFLESKGKFLKERLDEKTKEKTRLLEEIKNLIKKQKTLDVSTGSLEKKYNEVIKNKKGEVLEDYRKIITKIKLLESVDSFNVDTKKRIIITTKNISIKKPDWRRSRDAGQYQIIIDFSKTSFRDGIRAINVTKFHGSHDHPHLTDSEFCFGSELGTDLEQEFKEQDLYEIVVDTIDLLSSPNDSHGYTSWGFFMRFAKLRPKGYSFEKYEQEIEIAEEKKDPTIEPLDPLLATINSTATAEVASGLSYGQVWSYVQPYYQSNRVIDELRHLGLSSEAASYFASSIFRITNNEIPSRIEFQGNPRDGGYLYFRYGRNSYQEVGMNSIEGEPISSYPSETRIGRIFINPGDFVNERNPLESEAQQLNSRTQQLANRLSGHLEFSPWMLNDESDEQTKENVHEEAAKALTEPEPPEKKEKSDIVNYLEEISPRHGKVSGVSI